MSLRPLVEIIRLQSYVPDGTFGVIRINGEFTCLSLEPPWRNNQINVSCIPEGQYLAERFDSPKFGETFRFIDVSPRSDIEFHIGNTIKDTHGCPLLGSYIATFDGHKGIACSKRAFELFMVILGTVDEILVDVKRMF
ncbi:MAG: hypothetical protein J7K15_02830 [Deltaproteobacteria bacterium]|nr:hypothetical protein [Deltaproteobacteria bacterium]